MISEDHGTLKTDVKAAKKFSFASQEENTFKNILQLF